MLFESLEEAKRYAHQTAERTGRQCVVYLEGIDLVEYKADWRRRRPEGGDDSSGGVREPRRPSPKPSEASVLGSSRGRPAMGASSERRGSQLAHARFVLVGLLLAVM
jgi:hypothetical protein